MAEQKKYNDKSIGALWVRESKKGKPYLSGKILIKGQEYFITLFKNEFYQKGGNWPYFTILPALKKDDQKPKEEPEKKEINVEEIPF